jgi:hypothetical protein
LASAAAHLQHLGRCLRPTRSESFRPIVSASDRRCDIGKLRVVSPTELICYADTCRYSAAKQLASKIGASRDVT